MALESSDGSFIQYVYCVGVCVRVGSAPTLALTYLTVAANCMTISCSRSNKESIWQPNLFCNYIKIIYLVMFNIK